MKRFTVSMLFILILATSAFAADLKIANGSGSGTYKNATEEIKGVCGEYVNFIEDPTPHGSTQNFDLLVKNRVSAAFMHSDVIEYHAKSEKLGDYQTLLSLWKEDVHILVLNKPYATGMADKYTGRGRNLRDLSDLAGLPIGAATGGWVTANYMKLMSDVGYQIRQYEKGSELIPALDRGEVAAIFFVGAAPITSIEKLNKNYRLLTVNSAAKMSQKYESTTISYPNLAGSDSVATVAPRALLVAKKYKVAKFNEPLKQLRNCFYSKLNELQETPGSHPGWAQVDPADHGSWTWMQFK